MAAQVVKLPHGKKKAFFAHIANYDETCRKCVSVCVKTFSLYLSFLMDVALAEGLHNRVFLSFFWGAAVVTQIRTHV